MTGTSMASPYVAGVVGLMLAQNKDLTAAQCLGILAAVRASAGRRLLRLDQRRGLRQDRPRNRRCEEAQLINTTHLC